MSSSSLGVVLVALGTPRARRDLRLCGFSSTASLDQVCRTLSATGQYGEQTLRLNAMGALSKYIEKNFTHPRDAAKWLTILNRRLGVWAAVSGARAVLHLVQAGDQRPGISVDTAEAWVRGEATKDQVRKAGVEASWAAFDAFCDSATAAAAAARAAAWAANAVNVDSVDLVDSAAYSAYASGRAYGVASSPDIAAADDVTRNTDLRSLVSVIAERLVLFPEWSGNPAEDLWPMPTRKR